MRESGTSLKITDIATENKTPLISCAAAAAIVEPVNERKWIFKTAQSDKLAVSRLYKYISSKGIKNIAILTVANGFGQSGKTFLENMANDFNIKIVENQTFGAQDTDMKSQLTKIKSSKPEIIICWGTNPGPAYVVRNAKELGLNIPIYQSHGVGNSKYIELAGDSVEGTFLVAGKLLVNETLSDSDAQKIVLANYTKDYKEMFKENPSTFGGHGFDSISLVLKAIEEDKLTGKTLEEKRENLRNYLEGVKNFVGISGIFNFSESDHNGLTEDSFAIIEVKDGKWNFIE
ncbi:MAG TPA: ABC transporter substrate-binding protein [Spirochaetota bacterium]|nr:ABC transporter substrate-binding protein [Spirochaetota bacterium]